jgi:hypothetical protein
MLVLAYHFRCASNLSRSSVRNARKAALSGLPKIASVRMLIIVGHRRGRANQHVHGTLPIFDLKHRIKRG